MNQFEAGMMVKNVASAQREPGAKGQQPHVLPMCTKKTQLYAGAQSEVQSGQAARPLVFDDFLK